MHPPRVFGYCLLAASPLSGVFGFPLLAATNQLPALDPSRRAGEGATGLKRGQRRDTRKKLLEGSGKSVLAGVRGRGAGIAEPQKAVCRPAR